MASILVVDDEKIIRDGCQKVLLREGWEVKTASSGAEGLQLLEKEPCDLLLLDLKMPGLSGMEVLQQVKKLYPKMLVVVITGYATVESAVEAMKAGAYDFISKPFLPDQLRLVVQRALEKKALEWEADQLRREREKGLREIAEEKSKIKTIIHCMADGVLVADHEGNIVLYNPAFLRLLKIAEAFPKVVADFLQIEGWRELGESIRQVQEGSPISLEINQGKLTLMAHIAPVLSGEGEFLGTVTVLRDISMLKAIDQMKSDFVAMVAHELRSPLASIEQQLSVILAGILGEIGQRQQEMLGRAKERTHALLNLINDLLDLSKIEAGFVVQHKELTPMEEILEKVVEILRPQAEQKNISLELSFPPGLPRVMVDRRNMEEVFLNLVANGIKYTNDGGKVWLTAKIEGSYLLIEVGDNGLGISAEDLPHIFDKFYRVKNVQTRKITGTGLGLPIVKRIVEAHLGTVEVQSQPGVGSVFRVFLPLNLPPKANI
ncbi:MAG: response regulator [Thermodesulfobacteriota bacterium]